MSTTTETQSKRERSTLYIAVAVAIGVLMVVGLIFYSSAESTREAEDKADQLIAAIEDAGATAPDRDQIVRVLGDDGGAVCENPNESLSRAILLAQLANGAAGPGARPVIADSRVVRGQLLIIEIYCPDELEEFREFVDDLETDDVAGG
jgi:hypothetical protein